ncbi:MAG: hypothetical protein PHN32_06270 [Actinomycetota bacterium]|nr:hypothetical protein [Actinomycetota bacterium]
MKCAEKQDRQKIRHKEFIEDIFARPFLNKNPYCERCIEKGRSSRADKVVHIKYPGGNFKLFWDQNNWQGLCRHHWSKNN